MGITSLVDLLATTTDRAVPKGQVLAGVGQVDGEGSNSFVRPRPGDQFPGNGDASGQPAVGLPWLQPSSSSSSHLSDRGTVRKRPTGRRKKKKTRRVKKDLSSPTPNETEGEAASSSAEESDPNGTVELESSSPVPNGDDTTNSAINRDVSAVSGDSTNSASAAAVGGLRASSPKVADSEPWVGAEDDEEDEDRLFVPFASDEVVGMEDFRPRTPSTSIRGDSRLMEKLRSPPPQSAGPASGSSTGSASRQPRQYGYYNPYGSYNGGGFGGLGSYSGMYGSFRDGSFQNDAFD